ncbi:MAG: RNA polymerase sigma-70 factor [Bernardetiaceae bacterium]|nr:RNA polymerase sigma-70 factor [Bernardetiaceae bacterium]
MVQYQDYRAFQLLFEQYYRLLCLYALRLLPGPEMAEEVVADVFVKIWRNQANIQLKGSAQAYLFAAVKNQALDYLRSRQHRQSQRQQPEWPAQLGDRDPDPEQRLLQTELGRQLEEAVASLPPQCQLIFRLSRDEGRKYQEIADELGLSIKTVETQMGRALKFLREKAKGF